MSRYIRATQVIRKDYTAGSVSTSAYTELDSSIDQDISELEIFDSSGSVLKLAVGASGSESDLPFYIVPGGNANRVGVAGVTRGVRLSIKAVDTAASTGQLVINCFA